MKNGLPLLVFVLVLDFARVFEDEDEEENEDELAFVYFFLADL